MTLRVTWDPVKAVANIEKHGVSFEVAQELFGDPLLTIDADNAHSLEEDRYAAFGSTTAGTILFISYSIRGEDVRLISARRANGFEKRRYMNDKRTINDEPMEPEDDQARHFDWNKAVRGLHYIPREKGTVMLEEDVYAIFRTSEEVNNALRILIHENRIPHFLSDAEWNGKREK